MSWGATQEDWLHFDLILGLGADLLPVVSNPAAEISPDSRMKSKGKTPSVYNRQRKVAGFPKWTAHSADADDLERWAKEEDYGISVQTRRVRGFDIDVPEMSLAGDIRDRFVEELGVGSLPARVRSGTGKQLLAFALPGEFSKRSFKVDGGLVEFLAGGQQFIAIGTHPSGTRYEWVGGLPEEFPAISAEQFERAWAAIVEEFAIEPVRSSSRHSAGGAGGVAVSANNGAPDPVADFLEANWPTFGTQGGKLFVECPWKMGHSSDSGETEAAWLLAGTNGYQQGHYECLHASCSGRKDEEFLDAVGYRMADFDELPAVIDDHGREVQPRPNFKRSSPKKGYDATPSNVRMALERCDLTGMCIRYDTFRGEVMIADYPERMNWRSLKDPDYFELRVRLERMGFQQVGHDLVRQAIHWIADLQQFDTAQLWLESLPAWDGTPRIDRFLATYFGAADTAYTRAVGAYCWTAQAGRVMQPGVKADMIPVFIGEQGARKSSGVAAISPSEDFFVELGLQEKDDDMSRKMRGVLVAEIAELRGLNSRDAEGIKAWVAKRKEKWVAKYQENATLMARRLVFYGTSNTDEILADETGNRRWLPVGVGVVDVDGIERDRVQLWAEGLARWSANGVEYEAAERLGRLQHGAHRISDPWDERIERWLDEPDLAGDTPRTSGTLTVGVAMELALGLDIRSVKKADEMRVGKILRAMGLERVDKWVDGKTRKVWVDVSSPPIATSKTGGKA